jgi:aerotaxis receptor
MRINLPVTNLERTLQERDSVVSKTDIKGKITYVNRTFCEISGFSEEELLGQPQNIVRHPDMPPAAFADLWATLKAGESWKGLVKNRCKDGAFYWVEANANPIYRDGQVVGYMSLRTRPTREQIDHAERVYAAIREQRGGWTVRRGRILRTGLLGLGDRIGRLTLSARLTAAFVFLTVIATASTIAELAQFRIPLLAKMVVILATVAFSLQALRSMKRTLTAAQKLAEAVGSGDLSQTLKLERDDEIGEIAQSIQNIAGNLRGITSDVRDGSAAVASAAMQIAAGNGDLSARAQEQASVLEQTAAAMEEITTSVKENAENAGNAAMVVAHARSQAESGGQLVERAIGAMDDINRSSARISEIIAVIDGIAFQTNLLALNAAVEAARAGEQGRGFAVVASEVRNLAQRSAEASREVKLLVGDAVDKTRTGSAVVRESGEVLREIVAGVQKVTAMVSEIASASAEQSRGVGQINTAVVRMDDVTQQNASLVEEAASASNELRSQSERLDRLMGFFRIG